MYRPNWLRRFALLLFLLLPLSFGGCQISCEADDEPLEEAGERIEEAAEETGDALEEATREP